MNRLAKIEKINGYRKLLDLSLKPVTKDEAIQSEVQHEFEAWVSAQLEGLMGATPAAPGFTDEETVILKEFAQKTLARVSAQPAQPTQAPRPPAQTAARTPLVEDEKRREARRQALRGQAEPRRRSSETDEAFMERLSQWEDAQEN
jgi:hypothetical protein